MIHAFPQNGDEQRYVVSGRSPLPRWWVSSASPKAIGARGHKLGQNPVLSEKAGSEIFFSESVTRNHRVEREAGLVSEAILQHRSLPARAHKKSKPFSGHATDFCRFRRDLLRFRQAPPRPEWPEKSRFQTFKELHNEPL